MPPTRSSARVANTLPSSSRTSARQTAAANSAKPSIRLTVKAPPSKLRQALSGDDLPPNPYTESGDSPEPPIRNARSTRNPRAVIEPDSDEEMEDAEGEEDDEEQEQDDEEEGDEEEDAEGEEDEEEDADGDEEEEEEDEDEDDEEDAEGDTTMAESPHPPPPIIKTSKGAGGKTKIDIKVTAPAEGTLKSVEEKEEDMDGLSDLGSDEEDALGDTDDSDGDGERDGTPDLAKLTRRQRAAYEESLESGGGLMALSNEAQKKKHLTAEEHAMRRAEMARRRKNLSEKRNEEEKMDTINKLLKKPAPKRRTRAEMIAAANAAEAGEEGDETSADPLYVRWVHNSSGSKIGVPTGWLEGSVGETLSKGWTKPPEVKLVEEVQ
ncbi:Ino eighty subunit 2-like protein [Elsinoe fawcettii]|nr:Ino eighty subunit 2-like protein [Elsinoe fawcettii]